MSELGLRARFLDSYKRRKGRRVRHTGDEPYIKTKDKNVIMCNVPGCFHPMEFWKEDWMGDLIYTCTNPYCFKNKDYTHSVTTKLKKLTKELHQHSRRMYRKYDGTY